MSPLAAALMGLPVATLLFDRERVLACNGAGASLLGLDDVADRLLTEIMDATSVKSLLHSLRRKESPRIWLVFLTGAGRRVTVSGSLVKIDATTTALMAWEDVSWSSVANTAPSIRVRNGAHGLPQDCELAFLSNGRMSVTYSVDDPATISAVRHWIEGGMARPDKPVRHLAISR